MNSIRVSDLQPGQKYDKPVYVDGVNLLVPAGLPIKAKDIERLRKWGVEVVTTDGTLIQDDLIGGRASYVQQAFTSPEQREVLARYSSLRDQLSGIHDRIRSREPVAVEEIDAIVDDLFRLLGDRRNEVIQLVLYGLQGESGSVENAINSTVLALLTGGSLQMVKHKLLQLATATLLHDVGMLRLPREIIDKKGKLDSEELRQVRTHPIHSYRIITKELRYPEDIGIAALQHQERFDGQGYPKGLAGKGIVLAARIIAVADAFEAMVSKRPYRSPMIGYTAMRTILGDNSRRFDPDILKVFIRTMGIYPIGSVVVLNNSCVGRVVQTNPQAPLRPKVKIMIDEMGREFPHDKGKVIDLQQTREVFIARAVDPNELAESSTA